MKPKLFVEVVMVMVNGHSKETANTLIYSFIRMLP